MPAGSAVEGLMNQGNQAAQAAMTGAGAAVEQGTNSALGGLFGDNGHQLADVSSLDEASFWLEDEASEGGLERILLERAKFGIDLARLMENPDLAKSEGEGDDHDWWMYYDWGCHVNANRDEEAEAREAWEAKTRD